MLSNKELYADSINTPLNISQHKQGVFVALRPWLYRIWLLGITVALCQLLLWVQSLLDPLQKQLSPLQHTMQWVELAWLIPSPLMLVTWISWFIFADVIQPHPLPIEVPEALIRQESLTPPKPVRLVFRFITRGDNVNVLCESVKAVYHAFACYPYRGSYRIEIVTECFIDLGTAANERTHMYVVPADYVTKEQSRFKARALSYIQEQVPPQEEDYYIYLDEESQVDEHFLAGVYQFISKAELSRQLSTRPPAGIVGQGAIVYEGGHWFFRGADAIRTADDLGKFRLQYALGMPLIGMHGSFVVVKGIDDALVSFDVGSTNSITEDTAWALRAWSQGYRFQWIEGYLHEQPPQHIMDFVRQRARWLTGLRLVLRDEKVPLRYKISLAICITLWQLSFTSFSVAVLALFIHTPSLLWIRIPGDFVWVSYILSYLQGIDVQATHQRKPIQSSPSAHWQTIERISSWFLSLGCFWFILLELAGVLYSFLPLKGFFVIRKPSLVPKANLDAH